MRLLSVLLVAAVAIAHAQGPAPMQKFDLKDSKGVRWTNASIKKKKLVLIDYWATWCVPCIAMMPTVDKVHQKFKGKGLEVLSVSIDTNKAAYAKFIKGHKFPGPVLHDDKKQFMAWGIQSIPATYLVKDGKIVAKWAGKQDETTFTKAIEANLK